MRSVCGFCFFVLLSGLGPGLPSLYAGPFLDQYSKQSEAQYSYDQTIIEKGRSMSAAEKKALYRDRVGSVMMEKAALQNQVAPKLGQAIRGGVYEELKSRFPFLKFDGLKGAVSRGGGALSSGSVGGTKSGSLDSPASGSGSSSGNGQVIDLSKVKAVEVFPGPKPTGKSP